MQALPSALRFFVESFRPTKSHKAKSGENCRRTDRQTLCLRNNDDQAESSCC